MRTDNPISLLARRIRTSSRITVLTGAGVSAASGVPTFRGNAGLWQSYSPEDLATPEAFARDPGLVWEWYNWRRELIAACRPNAAHFVLAAWSRRYPGFTLLTQNVDGLHEQAGTENTVRFHGSIWEVSCWNRCPGSPARWVDATVPLRTLPPGCPYCGGWLRPGVVWFGEPIDPGILDRAISATDCDLFITAGTSSAVHPAAGLVAASRRRGAFTAEINPETTPASATVDWSVRGPAEVVLREVEDLLRRDITLT